MRSTDRVALLVLFWISGFVGLVYESIWTQYVELFVGRAADAQALVLCIFMAGLTLGAWMASHAWRRWENLFLAYAVLEAALGVLALLFHETFLEATGLAYDAVLPRLADAPAIAWVFRYGLSAALIYPQAVLLGMTFPLIVAAVLRASPERAGRSVALLYAVNSLGGAVGALATGFLLVHYLGLPGTVRLVGLVDLLVAVEVWRRFRRMPTAAAVAAPLRASPGSRAGLLFFLGVAFATGASSFLYEVAWIRMLSLVLGASSHAFELMLGAFVLGLGFGSWWIAGRIDGVRSTVRTLALVQLVMGLAALATLPGYGELFPVMRWIMEALPRSGAGYAWFNVASGGIALAVMLPTTVCAGMTLPLVTASLLRQGAGEASVGRVYGANTVGAIVAVLAAVGVMPLVGVKGVLSAGVAVDLGLAVVLAWRARPELSTRAVATLAATSAVVFVLTVAGVDLDPTRMASGVFRSGAMLDPTDEVVSHRDGRTATVSLIANRHTGQLRIATNGKVDAAVTMAPGFSPGPDESTMVLLGVLPMTLHPGATTAVCVGFGAGVTTHVLLSNGRLAEVHTVEIEPEMVRAAEGFRPRNELAYADPRSRIHMQDAKTFLAAGGTRYDLIVSEPSNPWVNGVASLFSDEFYRRAARHLNDGGVFAQWIQLYEITPALVVSVLKAMDRNFSDWAVYAATSTDAIIVARNGGPLGMPDGAVLALPGLAEPLARIGVGGLQDLDIRKIGDRRSWEGLLQSYSIHVNSDFYPVLDQEAARARFLETGARALLEFARDTLPIVDFERAPRLEPTKVTERPELDRSGRVVRATMLRDALAGREPSALAALPDGLREAAGDLLAWQQRCAAGSPEPLPLTSFLLVARTALPILERPELAAMWRPLASGRCAAALGPRERTWVELVEAVGARHGARMATRSRRLLESESLPPDDTRFLLAAGMLGALADGDPAEARGLWEQYGAGIDTRRDLLLRVLVARAKAADGAPLR